MLSSARLAARVTLNTDQTFVPCSKSGSATIVPSVADPKLLISYPDLDPNCQVITDPDPNCFVITDLDPDPTFQVVLDPDPNPTHVLS